MPHRAETIAATITDLVTNLPTTGDQVYRGRAAPISVDILPAVLVYLEGDSPLAEYTTLADRVLQVAIEGFARPAADEVDTVLNTIRREVTQALMADRTLGLGFVIDINEGEARYTLDGEADQGVGVVRTEWEIHYRRSITDPGA
jgi:hypothetical protein